MGWMLFLVVLGGLAFLMSKAHKAANWHKDVGARKGSAEYARTLREEPNKVSNLSEAEFVDQFVSNGPKASKYILGMVLLMVVGLPLSVYMIIAPMLENIF
jgi:hypothetical protein